MLIFPDFLLPFSHLPPDLLSHNSALHPSHLGNPLSPNWILPLAHSPSSTSIADCFATFTQKPLVAPSAHRKWLKPCSLVFRIGTSSPSFVSKHMPLLSNLSLTVQASPLLGAHRVWDLLLEHGLTTQGPEREAVGRNANRYWKDGGDVLYTIFLKDHEFTERLIFLNVIGRPHSFLQPEKLSLPSAFIYFAWLYRDFCKSLWLSSM